MKRFAAGVIASFLTVLIIIGIPIASVVSTLTSQKAVTGILTSNAVYQAGRNAINDIPLQTVGADQQVSDVANQAVDKTALNQILDKYFDYTNYKRIVGQVSAGVFSWLNGTTSLPVFDVKITSDPATFRNFITDTLVTRYQTLPVCTDPNVLNNNYDPLSADCRDPNQSAQGLRDDITKHMQGPDVNQLFQNATISSSEFFKNINPNDTARAQSAYNSARWAWLEILGTILVFGALLALLVPAQKRLRKTGLHLLIPAAIGLVIAFIFRMSAANVLNTALSRASQNNSASYITFINSLAKSAGNTIADRWLIITGVVALIGASLLIVKHFWGDKIVKPSKLADPKPDSPVKLPADPNPKTADNSQKPD